MMSRGPCFPTCCIFAALFSMPGLAVADEQVKYKLTFPKHENHYVQVEASFRDCGPQQQVFMPVWTPGSYLIREYARHVDSVEASDAKGTKLAIKKVNKNRWQVDNSEKQSSFTVRYRIYCNELSVRTNFVDSQFALLNGAAVFLTRNESLEQEHVVAIELPSQWKQAVTALERRVELGANVFVARNFDELVDSPIVAGNPNLHPFTVGGIEHFLVNLGDASLWDGDTAAADVAKIVAEHQKMWGRSPYKRYLFLNVIAESGGGLEHDNSTVLLTSRWSFRSPNRYNSWLGLVSHEFFHTWNVRRLRPKVLANYDYEVENYFEELWVAEGVTSYYDDLALARSGFNSTRKHLEDLSKRIRSLQNKNGRLKQSLALSSHDAWIKFYRPDENSSNTSISYYNKGSVVAFLLDIEIRRATENKKSLDDVMRALYDKYALKEGYSNADVLAEVNRITGKDLSEWFDRAIYSTEELNYQAAFDWLGLKFVVPSSGEEATKAAANGPIWTGISTKTEDGKTLVSSIVESGPGFDAGINVDDEIIAVNDYRVSSSLSELLDQFKGDKEVELLIARRGALSRVKLKLKTRASSLWRVDLVKKPTVEQKKNLATWLHQPEKKK